MMNGLNILPSYTSYFTLTTSTTALNTASVWLGGTLSVVYAKVPDLVGRKWALFYGAALSIIGAALQAAAQNSSMFIFSRILIGFGTGATSIAVPVYLAETLPVKYRASGLGMVYDAWYVGGLIAAGATYGTAKMESTWAWRLPSLLQGVFSVICVVLLFFTPESPRWLVRENRKDEAYTALSQSYSNGDVSDPVVQLHMAEILETLDFERENKPYSVPKILRHKNSLWRIFIGSTCGMWSCLSGNNIISYYLGDMLDSAGITDTTTQLEINIILNAWCLAVSLVGTVLCDKLGRKQVAILSTLGCVIFIFLIGGLTKLYGTSTNTSGVYGTVACIFLFQGAYSLGWTPLAVMYPPEVMNYNIRSVGMGIYTFFTNGSGLMVTLAFPYALDAIGWKTYMINGLWDVVEIAVVVLCWVETKGKTLEEVYILLEGEVHSSAAAVVIGIDPEQQSDGDEGSSLRIRAGKGGKEGFQMVVKSVE
jgi:sugar porter (SP) family MFS transporter